MFIEYLQIALISAVIGYTYSAVLIQPGEALHWLYRIFRYFLTRKEIKKGAEIPEELQGRVGYKPPKVIETEITHEHWLLKPLGACEKCTSGQVAMWLFLGHSIIDKYYLNNISIFVIVNHIFTICLAILLTILFKKILTLL